MMSWRFRLNQATDLKQEPSKGSRSFFTILYKRSVSVSIRRFEKIRKQYQKDETARRDQFVKGAE